MLIELDHRKQTEKIRLVTQIGMIGVFLLYTDSAFGCPGCRCSLFWYAHPEYIAFKHLLGIWTTLMIVNWNSIEQGNSNGDLRVIITVAMLAQCTPLLFILPYGIVLGLPMLFIHAKRTRGRPDSKLHVNKHYYTFRNIVMGLLIGVAFPVLIAQLGVVWLFIGYFPVLILIVKYFYSTPRTFHVLQREILLLIVLLGSWLSFPVYTLASLEFSAGLKEGLDTHALRLFDDSISYIWWVPVIISSGLVVMRKKLKLNLFARSAIVLSLVSIPLALDLNWPRPEKPMIIRSLESLTNGAVDENHEIIPHVN